MILARLSIEVGIGQTTIRKPKKMGNHPKTLADKIRRQTGLDVAKCYQCGKCSAGCPMAGEMHLRTHQIIRLAQIDMEPAIFNDESIWCCLTCETCTVRCPNGFDPARLIDGLREMSLQQGKVGPHRIDAFHRAFLDQIRLFGRVFEFGLVADYKLRSGAFLDDVTAAPGMISRGKLPFAPHRIKGTDQVKRIFERCEAAGRKKKR